MRKVGINLATSVVVALVFALGTAPTLHAYSVLSHQDSVEVASVSFEEVTLHGDAVYFEFCLHEMGDPEEALIHAKSLASDIVVYERSPGSECIYYGAEENKVARSYAVMEHFGIRRRQTFHAEQRFANYAELLAKVRPQGPLAIERAQRFAGTTDIVIPMSYELNLL